MTQMLQGYSGSTVRLVDGQVEKVTSDRAFAQAIGRQAALIDLSRRMTILPRIARIEGATILMEYIVGTEGLTEHNAQLAGASLRLLHDCSGFTYPCQTGVDWLVLLANTGLAKANSSTRVSQELALRIPNDALIHSEPSQFIETVDGRIVFIDIEGIGRGSRYQDLGFIEYRTRLLACPGVLASFMRGYLARPIDLDLWRIQQMAGLIAMAYSNFADAEMRLMQGLQWMAEAESHFTGKGATRASSPRSRRHKINGQ